jgi:hypothetical protein
MDGRIYSKRYEEEEKLYRKTMVLISAIHCTASIIVKYTVGSKYTATTC